MKRLISACGVLLLLGAGCPLWPTTPAPEAAPPETQPEPAPEPEVSDVESDRIRADIRPGDQVASPLALTGEARGNWYFEADFPIRLHDASGKELAVAIAQAQGEWMTTEFVPFKATMTFESPASGEGVLIYERHNASGLPEHDEELRVPVRFGKKASVDADGCRRTGCSGQICADEDMVSTCEYRPEYACYKDAACERQADGKCGWTKSSALTDCRQSILGPGAGL